MLSNNLLISLHIHSPSLVQFPSRLQKDTKKVQRHPDRVRKYFKVQTELFESTVLYATARKGGIERPDGYLHCSLTEGLCDSAVPQSNGSLHLPYTIAIDSKLEDGFLIPCTVYAQTILRSFILPLSFVLFSPLPSLSFLILFSSKPSSYLSCW